MEGLEINTVLLSECINLDYGYRFDAEFYKKEDLVLNNRIISCPHNKLVDLITKIDVGYVGSMVCEYTNEKTAPILLQTKNIAEFFVNAADIKRINPTFHNSLQKSQVRFENILIARSGSFGNASIYLEREVINSADIIIVEADKNRINPYYLVAYLNSRLGRRQLYRFASGGLQGHINLTILEQLHVVLPSVKFQEKVEQTIQKAYSYTQLAIKNYALCEQMLLSEIKMNHWTPGNDTVSYNRFSDFVNSGRLDAEYYQPKYDEIVSKISQYSCGQNTIGNLFILRDSNFLPDNNVQYKYIELSDIGVNGEVSGCTYEYGSNLPSRARRIVHAGDIIISSIEGSLQNCAIITEEYNGALCSTGFYVLTPQIINLETSLVLFKSTAIQSLLKRACTGTILTAINKDEFININLPIINTDIQNKIAGVIQQSTAFRSETRRLLNLAKTMVETAIEKGEDAAMKLLNQ